MKRIVFVCTGNVFRSFCAERSLKKLHPELLVYSRGIDPALAVHPSVLQQMAELGLEPGAHQPTRFNEQDKQSLCVAMSTRHQQSLLSEFGMTSVLYQRLAVGQDLSILDVNEALLNYKNRQDEVLNLIHGTINYLVGSMPQVSAEITRRLRTN